MICDDLVVVVLAGTGGGDFTLLTGGGGGGPRLDFDMRLDGFTGGGGLRDPFAEM